MKPPLLIETTADVWGSPAIREWYCDPPGAGVPFLVREAIWLDEAEPDQVTVEQVHQIEVLS